MCFQNLVYSAFSLLSLKKLASYLQQLLEKKMCTRKLQVRRNNRYVTSYTSVIRSKRQPQNASASCACRSIGTSAVAAVSTTAQLIVLFIKRVLMVLSTLWGQLIIYLVIEINQNFSFILINSLYSSAYIFMIPTFLCM